MPEVQQVINVYKNKTQHKNDDADDLLHFILCTGTDLSERSCYIDYTIACHKQAQHTLKQYLERKSHNLKQMHARNIMKTMICGHRIKSTTRYINRFYGQQYYPCDSKHIVYQGPITVILSLIILDVMH